MIVVAMLHCYFNYGQHDVYLIPKESFVMINDNNIVIVFYSHYWAITFTKIPLPKVSSLYICALWSHHS